MGWKWFERKAEALQLEEIIIRSSTEIRMNEFLFEHGKWLIANCIAKSDICTVINGKLEKSDMYYLLNIRPNPNQSATEFWLDVINKYFSYKGEVLIVDIGGCLYVADSYVKSNNILRPQVFSDVSITIDGSTLKSYKYFDSSTSMLIRRIDKNVDIYLSQLNDKISDLMIASMSSYRKKSPKYSFKIPQGTIMQDKDGKVITNNELTEQVNQLLDNPNSSVIKLPDTIALDEIKTSSTISASEIESIFNQAAKNVAMALNIPINAFVGSITEKSDAVDEMITFAVSIIIEQINDSLNYCLMNKDSFLNGSSIFFDLSNCKHRDILSNATGIDKLTANGFSHNEILGFFGKPPIDEPWANEHYITKNNGKTNDDDMKGGEE